MMQREKTEKVRRRRGRIAAILAAVLMVTSVSAVTAFADCSADLTACTVTVSLPTVAADDTSFDEIGVAGVVLDFYQVTPAVDLTGYDAYEFGTWNAPFTAYEKEWTDLANKAKAGTALTADEVNGFTQHLASAVLDAAAAPSYTARGTLGAAPTSVTVPGGMYLVLAHSSADAAVADYAVKTTDAAGKATYATKADGETKRYLFAPMLVTAPVKKTASLGSTSITAGDEKVEITIPAADSNTAADRGDWADAASLVVKVGVTDLEGSLKITKNLLNHETMEGRADKDTFIYRIESDKGFSGAESIVFESGGSTKSVVVDHIPMGATVTVTEIYTGSDYKPVGESVKTAKITPSDPETGEGMAEVVFSNEHNGGHKGGGSVKNTYGTTSNDGGITWTWSDTPAPSYADDTSIR